MANGKINLERLRIMREVFHGLPMEQWPGGATHHEFTVLFGLSDSFTYAMLRSGSGPASIMIGSKRIYTWAGIAAWQRRLADEAAAIQTAKQQDKQSAIDADIVDAPVKRGRGRPPGSKNKSKAQAQAVIHSEAVPA